MTGRHSSDVAGLHRAHPQPYRRSKAFRWGMMLNRVSILIAAALLLAMAATAAFLFQR